ncbi:hypothetical protein HaLaN_20588, partial [Haematococcus lacustris]
MPRTTNWSIAGTFVKTWHVCTALSSATLRKTLDDLGLSGIRERTSLTISRSQLRENLPLVIKTTPRLHHICAGCYGGSNLHIQIHALFAHAGLAARDRRDRRGPGTP